MTSATHPGYSWFPKAELCSLLCQVCLDGVLIASEELAFTKDYLWASHNPLFYLGKHKTHVHVLCFTSHAVCLLLPSGSELSRRTYVNSEIEDSCDN